MSFQQPKPSQKSHSLRPLSIHVKTARGRTSSSQRWLHRHLNDPFVQKAQIQGYRSRAAFKLAEIDDQFGFLKAGGRVLDLGSAPGSWLQVVTERIHAHRNIGQVLGIDVLEVEPLASAHVIQGDFFDPVVQQELKHALQGPANCVLSDMAAATTGHRITDHLRTSALAEAAFQFAQQILAPGGTFVTKVFQGGTGRTLLEKLKGRFLRIKHIKPTASRKESSEMYVVALGFKGGLEHILK